MKAKYTIVFFYAYDCPHCQKQSPALVDFMKRAHEKNWDLKIFTVSTKQGEQNIEPTWKYVKEKNFSDFINTNDPFGVSRFFNKYDIQSTPQIYVLDENKIIRSKSIEAKQLDEVVDYLIKDEAQKIAKQVNKK